ncbi:MAG: helix-turn-helix domain-containing protein [Oscillospiraceae bacterium]|nr:helix-turn-helix domain-containing protein [Oscillospiraceae bacterium]
MEIKSIPLILKNVRIQQGYTQNQIAEILNTTQQQVCKYENINLKNYRDLPLRHLVTLARLYNVSADYLLGLTDVPDPYPRSPEPEEKGQGG